MLDKIMRMMGYEPISVSQGLRQSNLRLMDANADMQELLTKSIAENQLTIKDRNDAMASRDSAIKRLRNEETKNVDLQLEIERLKASVPEEPVSETPMRATKAARPRKKAVVAR